MRKGKLIRFYRGARRHPKWDLGTPPNPRGRSPFATTRVGLMGLVGAQDNGCRLVSVTDGDTLRLYCPNRGLIEARLTGFDAPELFSARCASEFRDAWRAKWALRWMLMTSKDLKFVREGTDDYGRALIFASTDGVPVARKMISSGLARPYDGEARLGWC